MLPLPENWREMTRETMETWTAEEVREFAAALVPELDAQALARATKQEIIELMTETPRGPVRVIRIKAPE